MEKPTYETMVIREGDHLMTELNINKIIEFEEVDDVRFTSLALIDESVFAFDLNSSQIFKFDSSGSFVKSAGGIGRGPGEFIVDNNAEIGGCDNKHIYAFDWNLPRIQLYDNELELVKFISLEGVPYEINCYESKGFVIQYSSSSRTDIIEKSGKLFSSKKLIESEELNLDLFNRIFYDEGRFFQAYMFTPKIRVWKDSEIKKEILLEADQDVRSAFKLITSDSSNLHLFYHNLDEEEKKGYVFSLDGELKMVYQIPKRFNYLKIIDDNKIVAIENGSKNINTYTYDYE